MGLLKRRAADPVPAAAPRSVASLIATLRGAATAAERRAAALDLMAAPEAAAELIAALAEEPHVQVQQAIVTALISIGTSPASAGLAKLLASGDTALRNAAIEALQQMGAPAAVQMEALLAAPDPDLRLFALNVLSALRYPPALAWLRVALDRDENVNVGLAAVEALAEQGGPADAPAFRAFAARFPGEAFVAFAVTLACRRVLSDCGT